MPSTILKQNGDIKLKCIVSSISENSFLFLIAALGKYATRYSLAHYIESPSFFTSVICKGWLEDGPLILSGFLAGLCIASSTMQSTYSVSENSTAAILNKLQNSVEMESSLYS